MDKQSEIARKLAAKIHKNQFRRDGVTPYIFHTQAVADKMREEGYSDDHVAIAEIHDAKEDQGLTDFDMRTQGLNERVISGVNAISKKVNESYKEYLTRVFDNKLAFAVKLRDIEHNLSDSPSEKQVTKYKNALNFFQQLMEGERIESPYRIEKILKLCGETSSQEK